MPASESAAVTPDDPVQKIPRGAERRRQLIAEAARVLLRDGMEGTSMDLIASEAGASKATLYRHFGDRHGLVVEAVQFLCEDFVDDVQPKIRPGDDLPTRLRAILDELVRVLLKPEHPDFFRLVTNGAAVAPEIGEAWYRHGPLRWRAMLMETLEAARADGTLAAEAEIEGYPEMLFDAVFSNTIIATAVLGKDCDPAVPQPPYLDRLIDGVILQLATPPRG